MNTSVSVFFPKSLSNGSELGSGLARGEFWGVSPAAGERERGRKGESQRPETGLASGVIPTLGQTPSSLTPALERGPLSMPAGWTPAQAHWPRCGTRGEPCVPSQGLGSRAQAWCRGAHSAHCITEQYRVPGSPPSMRPQGTCPLCFVVPPGVLSHLCSGRV